MKNYNEMAESVLKRANAVIAQKNKRRNTLITWTAGTFSCFALAVLTFGFSAGWFSPDESYLEGIPSHDGGEVMEELLNSTPEESEPDEDKVQFLTREDIFSDEINGNAFLYVQGAYSHASSSSAAPPQFSFDLFNINLVARALEELPGVYETLNEYGSTKTYSYRLFRMEVINPLESGMDGEFYYLLPKNLSGDLTKYDAVLMSMGQLPKNFVLRQGNKLSAFEYIFTDPGGDPELGNIVPFTQGIFDESLWQEPSWLYGYQFGRHMLDENYDSLVVFRGATLEEALARREALIDDWGMVIDGDKLYRFEYTAEEANSALKYLRPFENGVYAPMRHFGGNMTYYRYINGCPTNEWIFIGRDGVVQESEFKFDNGDYDNLPDISAYIGTLVLSEFAPLHTDTESKTMIFNSAVGWYEKTETGVYSIVRIAWRYFDEEDWYTEYYDETFILLGDDGDRVVSREELIDLIGPNQNISYEEYGVGIEMPMC